ncbi:MAG: rhomboid family intramembrane serine protease [Chloroflexi bacterium]|nr:rhomboid family intramembrane serine protease [Chloroflexota bacterium]MBI3740675.1 rhomboid family intramembrane serine protease [Chloroflexota bacterium]
MIPLGDSNPTQRVPIVNWLLIAANVLVFLFELTLPSRQLDRLFLNFGAIPNQILLAIAHPTQTPLTIWATLFTSMFLHSGWAHIIGNMLFLWVFGDNIEDTLGHFVYLIFYFASGLLAGLAQVYIAGASNLPSIGASGAIAGVLGGYILLYPLARVRILFPLFILFTTIQLPALVVIGWWFIQQFFYGIGSLSSSAQSGVAFWAHIGGFIAGLILIVPFIGRARRRRPTLAPHDAYEDYYRRF